MCEAALHLYHIYHIYIIYTIYIIYISYISYMLGTQLSRYRHVLRWQEIIDCYTLYSNFIVPAVAQVVHACTYTHKHTHICMYTCTHTCIHIHTRICTHKHMQTHTCTHISHAHTYTLNSKKKHFNKCTVTKNSKPHFFFEKKILC